MALETNNISTLTGTEEERTVFKYALTRNHPRDDEIKDNEGPRDADVNRTNNANQNGGMVDGAGNAGKEVNKTDDKTTNSRNARSPESILPLPQISMRFEEVHLRVPVVSLHLYFSIYFSLKV